MTYRPRLVIEPFAPFSEEAKWRRLADTLRWLYGAQRAAAIMNGEDEATEADIEVWRTLGEKHPR